MNRCIYILMMVLLLALCLAVPSFSYTVSQLPPSGVTNGTPYLLLNVAGRHVYAYPPVALLEYLSITPGDVLAGNVSTLTSLSYSQTTTSYTRAMTIPVMNAPAGDGQLSFLVLNVSPNGSPSNGQSVYPVTTRWYWLTAGSNSNFTNGTPSLISGSVVVLDTNIPQFTPKNEVIAMASPNQSMVRILGILLAVALIFNITQVIGRYKKGANHY